MTVSWFIFWSRPADRNVDRPITPKGPITIPIFFSICELVFLHSHWLELCRQSLQWYVFVVNAFLSTWFVVCSNLFSAPLMENTAPQLSFLFSSFPDFADYKKNRLHYSYNFVLNVRVRKTLFSGIDFHCWQCFFFTFFRQLLTSS